MAVDALIIKNLVFGWDSSDETVRIDELKVSTGEKVFIHGPSGSGKTTFLGLIGGVLNPRSGEIRVLGENIAEMKSSVRDRFRADHIGYVFQMFNLLPFLSVAENIKMGVEFSRARKRKLENSPNGMDREVSRLLLSLDLDPSQILVKKVSDLSVGQQQRVAVARALVGQPEMIIADEPTSALDANTCDQFMELLIQECARAGSTLIFVSHDRQLEKRFDRAISLGDLNRPESRVKK